MKWKTQMSRGWESWDWWWISLESLIYIWWQLTQQVGSVHLRYWDRSTADGTAFQVLYFRGWDFIASSVCVCVCVHVTSNFLQILYGSCRSITVGDYRRNSKAEALPHRALKLAFYELSTASGDLNKYIHFLRKVWGAGWKDEWKEPHQHIRPQVFFSPRIEWNQVILQANLKTNLGLEWYQSSINNLQNLILRAIRPTKTRNLSPKTSQNIHAVNCHFTILPSRFLFTKPFLVPTLCPTKIQVWLGSYEPNRRRTVPEEAVQFVHEVWVPLLLFGEVGKIHIFWMKVWMK